MAEVLGRLGAEHIMVVHSADGLDEISIATETYVAEYKNGAVTEYTIAPEDFLAERQSLDGLDVEDAKQSLALIIDALGKQAGPNASKAADLIALNAGAALYVAGCASGYKRGRSHGAGRYRLRSGASENNRSGNLYPGSARRLIKK